MRVYSLALAFAAALAGQTLQFDAASIRSTAATPGAEGSGRERVEVTSTTLSLRNASLSFAIQWAYGVQFYQVAGPEWLKDARYDIQARPPGVASEGELRRMLRVLLAERFQLVMHTEQRSRPVYSLVARGTPKLQKADVTDSASFGVADGDFVFRATSMPEFADRLSDFATVDRPVIDNTGLAGRFHFKLDQAARAMRGGDGPSIFTAVSELGLRMQPVSLPVEVFVVDGAERSPSEN
jgi:uncharacterized protein (TIGR03435 family)